MRPHDTFLKRNNARLREQLLHAQRTNLATGERLATMTRERDNARAEAEMMKKRAEVAEGNYAVVVTLVTLASDAMRAQR